MKVAVLGDVHANLPALEAVLAHAAKQKVEAIWNVGDFLGYGPFPEEVVARLRKEAALSIIGNYDQKVLQVKRKKEEWQKTKPPEKLFAFQWAYDQLSKESRDYLRDLPQELRIKSGGKKVLLVHGSPASNKEHLTSETPDKRLKELAKNAQADVIICGHSHQPFVKEIEGVCFINPGAVGRPDDGDPRASYAVLNISGKSFQVQHYRVKYDVARTLAALHEQKLPDSFAEMVKQGKNLEAVSEDAAGPAPVPPSPVRDEKVYLQSALELAERYHDEEGHSRQVARLSLLLFDQLQGLHGLGREERLWLHLAGLLHDLGLNEGAAGHHKTSLRIIISEPLPPLEPREQTIVALVARYHRRALPDLRHDYFAALDPADQKIVEALAGLLRVADGLDRTHESVVQTLSCEVTADEIIIKAAVLGPAEEEREFARQKGDLLQKAFKRNLIVKCRQI